ncbi:insulinase family protein [Candidatus Babeliales bacterium]|nr:insulinase family protein [Candidatus Babeliales bacterium]
MEFFAKYKMLFGFTFMLVCVAGFLFVWLRMYRSRGMSQSFFRTRPNFLISTEGVTKHTLENGMTLLIFKNNSIPKVLMQIAYNVGSYVEEGGERGLAHLIEHMIFKGTQKMSETDIDEIARKYGVSHNAFTSKDVTSYYFESNKNNWKPFMSVLADCMQNARFDDQHLASELKAVVQELKMYKDDYWSMMFEKINSVLFPANHPYHYPIIGYKDDLMNLSSDTLKAFYKKYYTPDRATLFVIGDVNPDEVIQEVNEQFGSLTADHEAQIHSFPRLPIDLSTQHTTLFEDIATEQLGFYWRIPGLKDEHEMLSSMAAYLLGGGEGSRMHRALVDEHKVASSIGVYAEKYMEEGVFAILLEPVNGKREDCLRIVREELKKAVDKGFNDKELEHVTKTQAKRFFQRMQQFKNFTYEWLTSFFATGDEFAVFKRVNKFVEIESADVQKFIAQYLDPILVNQIEVIPMPDACKKLSERAKQESDQQDEDLLAKYERTLPIEGPKLAETFAQPSMLDFTFPKPHKTLELKNGLKVLLHQNHYLPLLSLNCKFKESFYLSNSREGVVLDLMMEMLMEGSKGFAKKDNVDFFEFHGAGYSFGATGAGLSMLNADADKIFERFVHVLTSPTFPSEALEKLKNIAVDAFLRSKDEITDRGIRELKSMIYKNHPFGWQIDEAIEMAKAMTVADAARLHKEYLSPENMILTVVGDFDMQAMEATIRAVFEKMPVGKEVTVQRPTLDFTPSQVSDIRMVRDQVVLLFGRPSPVTIYHPDLIPLKILNYIGFYSLGSRLFKLREQSGLFYTAFGGWASNASKDTGFDYVGAILSPDKLEVAEKGIRSLIEEMGHHGITQVELDGARQLYLKSLIDAVSNNAAVAELLGSLEAFGLGFDYYDKALKQVQTIELDQLNKLCAQYFTMNDMGRVRVGRVG